MTSETNPSRLSPYWLWNDCIPRNVLDAVLSEINEATFDTGSTVSGNKSNERNSDVILTHGNHWFAGILANLAINSNRAARWNFDVTQCQMLQIAKYQKDQHYDWHIDTDVLSLDPEHRKLTAICLLSEPAVDYTGGTLELKHVITPTLKMGSVIVFPSIMQHRVCPVLTGTRISATSWINGPRIK